MTRPRLAVIGLGLIGGSLARALRAAEAVSSIVGYDLDPEQRRAAVELGVVDRAAEGAAAAVEGVDARVEVDLVGGDADPVLELVEHRGWPHVALDEQEPRHPSCRQPIPSRGVVRPSDEDDIHGQGT